MTGAVPRQRRDSGLGCARLGGSLESMQPQAIKSALPLIQDHSSRLIAVKNSCNGKKNSVWTICHSVGAARLRREEVCLAFFVLQTPFPLEQTFSSVPGLMPRDRGFPCAHRSSHRMGTRLWVISEPGWPPASDLVVKGSIPLPSPTLPKPLITFPKRWSQVEGG